MTTVVLRPNGTVSVGGAVTGAANAHTALSDDSDSSYVTGSATVAMGTFTLGAGVTKTAQVRVRGRAVTGTDTIFGAVVGLESTVKASGSITTSISTKTGAAAPVTWSQADINGLQMSFRQSQAASSSNVRGMELYLDVVHVEQPVVAVDAISPDPYTASTFVPVSWVNTLDADGGVQQRYGIKAYDATTHGAFGSVDPDTTPPFYGPGHVVSSATSATIGPLPNDTYRIFVRTSQTVNGVTHTSEWDSVDITVAVSDAEIDTVTMVADNATGSIEVTVERDTGTEAWDFIEVQRSLDAGATWSYVRGAAYVDATGDADTFVVDDYEVANSTDALYRARATRIVSELPITGPWVESAADEQWASGDCWLKAPNDPSLNMVFSPDRQTKQRTRRSGVFDIIGSQFAIVVSDARTGFSGVLPVLTDSAAEHAALRALLNGSDVLLVQYPPAFDIADAYVSVLSDDEVFASAAPLQLARTWALRVVEVAAPGDPDAGV